MSRPPEDDWRRQGQERYLRGRSWALRRYTSFREGWDHDHCCFCNAKLSLSGDDLRRGYVTEDDYYWVCEACFPDFRDEMDWKVKGTLLVPFPHLVKPGRDGAQHRAPLVDNPPQTP